MNLNLDFDLGEATDASCPVGHRTLLPLRLYRTLLALSCVRSPNRRSCVANAECYVKLVAELILVA